MKRTFVLLITLVFSSSAFAVIELNVNAADKPSVQSGTISFTNTDGSLAEAEVNDDGNIVITGDKGNGGQLTVTPAGSSAIDITVPPGTRKGSIDLRRATFVPIASRPARRPFTETPAPMLSLQYGMAYGDLRSITPGLGQSEGPGEERAFSGSDDELDLDIAGINFSFPVFGHSSLYFSYADGDGDDSGRIEVEPGSIDTYIVATGDVSGIGTGVFLGPSGGLSEFEHDYEYDKFKVGFGFPLNCDWMPEIDKRGRIDLTYARFDQDFSATNAPVSIAGLSHRLNQSLDSEAWQLRAGVDGVYRFNDQWSLSAGLGISYQQVDVDFSSVETFDLFGSLSTLRLRDDDTYRDFGGHARIGLGLDVGNFNFAIEGVYETGLSTSGIRNANDGDDIFLDNFRSQPDEEDSDNLYWGLSVGYRFN